MAMVLEGTLTSVSPEQLEVTLLDGSSFTIFLAQLQRAEVLASRRNTLKGTVVGVGIGLGVGVALVVTSRGAERGGDAAFGDEFQAWKLIVPSVAGALLGALAGYSIRTMRWAPAVVPGSAGSPRDFALAWTVAVG